MQALKEKCINNFKFEDIPLGYKYFSDVQFYQHMTMRNNSKADSNTESLYVHTLRNLHNSMSEASYHDSHLMELDDHSINLSIDERII